MESESESIKELQLESELECNQDFWLELESENYRIVQHCCKHFTILVINKIALAIKLCKIRGQT